MVLFPAAGVGIASQNPSFDRIRGPVSWAPMITGALDQTSAAAFGPAGYDPVRSRRLLLHKSELNELIGKTAQKGLTLVPLRVYTKGPRIKLEFALARRRKKYDKREMIKKRDIERETGRNL